MYDANIEDPYPERKGPPSKWYVDPHCAVIAPESDKPRNPRKPDVERPNPLISLSPK